MIKFTRRGLDIDQVIKIPNAVDPRFIYTGIIHKVCTVCKDRVYYAPFVGGKAGARLRDVAEVKVHPLASACPKCWAE